MLELLILSLAAWRLTSIIHREGIARPLRGLVGAKETEIIEYPDTFLGELFSCFWCLSVWISAVCLIIYFIFPPTLYVFALSGAVILIEEVKGWLEHLPTQ